jgi:hypothetical protein
MRILFNVFAILLVCAPAWAGGLADLTQGEAAGGLKEALIQGAGQAVSTLGRTDGFLKNPKVRIPLPDALAQVEPVLRTMGKGKDLDKLVTTMNRAAEDAVPKAKELLVAAAQKMTVSDAKQILSGGEDSVTQFFKGKTMEELTAMFLPAVKASTDKLSLAKQYNKLAGKAANFGLVKQEDAQIEQYVTRRALDGLYTMIAEEERKIRRDPVAAVGSLAQKVFGALGN